jgi:NADPH:quinone reductase-like Zn-dependent oxidoreductase
MSMTLKRALGWTAIAIPVALVLAFSIAYWRSDNSCGEGAAAAPGTPMKAIIYCDYGDADVLRLEDVERPVPTDDQVLVKVHAASLNPLDWHFMRGTPYLVRMMAGLRRPADTRLGVDFSGTVEAVGRNVTQFKPGDEVFGGADGALAEYVAVRADRAVVPKPASVSFEQAASVPIAAITALQSLRDKAKVQPGERVLINGASGGVGTFAVQIAKSMGAVVTGVCSTRNLDMVRLLGADRVVDYTKEDFATRPERYDVVVDNVGNRSLSEFRSVLTPKGRYVLVGGGGPNDHPFIGPFGRVIGTLLQRPFIGQQMGMFIADLKKDDLAVLAGLMESGKVTPVIDRRYPLSEAASAMRYLEEGHARGKVIVTME